MLPIEECLFLSKHFLIVRSSSPPFPPPRSKVEELAYFPTPDCDLFTQPVLSRRLFEWNLLHFPGQPSILHSWAWGNLDLSANFSLARFPFRFRPRNSLRPSSHLLIVISGLSHFLPQILLIPLSWGNENYCPVNDPHTLVFSVPSLPNPGLSRILLARCIHI